jgi:bifunctional DNase/RNase
MEAPIFVHETVLRDANVSVDGQDEEEKQKWKDFLENLDEDDFGKYKM